VSDTGNHRIQYYRRNKEVQSLNLNVEFPIGTCLTSDSRLIIIDWKGAKMLRNGKISAPVSGSRVAKIYKGKGVVLQIRCQITVRGICFFSVKAPEGLLGLFNIINRVLLLINDNIFSGFIEKSLFSSILIGTAFAPV